MEWIFIIIGILALFGNPAVALGILMAAFLVVGSIFFVMFLIAGNGVAMLLLGIPLAIILLMCVAAANG